jgi:hypothetical protein
MPPKTTSTRSKSAKVTDETPDAGEAQPDHGETLKALEDDAQRTIAFEDLCGDSGYSSNDVMNRVYLKMSFDFP